MAEEFGRLLTGRQLCNHMLVKNIQEYSQELGRLMEQEYKNETLNKTPDHTIYTKYIGSANGVSK